MYQVGLILARWATSSRRKPGSAAARAGSSFCRVPKANMKTTCLTPLHGRVNGSDVLWLALSKFRIDSCNNERTIETRIGLLSCPVRL